MKEQLKKKKKKENSKKQTNKYTEKLWQQNSKKFDSQRRQWFYRKEFKDKIPTDSFLSSIFKTCSYGKS